MKFKITRAPGSMWFGYWKATPRVRDIADYVIWICGWQIKIFRGDNPWK